MFASKILEVSLRVLNAYTNHTPPSEADEAHLRKMTGDASTPSDELACQIIQAELRKNTRAEGSAAGQR